jgi:acyl carrier protein
MAAPTQDGLRQMLAETTGVDESSITLDSRFDDLGLESSDAASFMSAVQERYGTQLDASDLGSMQTVGDFYRRLVASGS